MKKALLLITLGMAAAVSTVAEEIQLPHVTVYGTATTEVLTDQMLWSLRVENKGPSLEGVAEEHTRIVQAVLSLLKESKLDGKLIQTSRMEFGENWEYRSSSRVRDGYVASTEISFKISDFNLYKKFWLGLAKIPGVSVSSVAYDHSKRIEYQNETRKKAVLAAREKAISLAHALGAEVGEPLLIEEVISFENIWDNNTSNNLRTASGEPSEPSEALSPGTIPIKMRVKTAFRLLTSGK